MVATFVSAVSALVLKGLKSLGAYLVRLLAKEIAKRMPKCDKEKGDAAQKGVK